VWKNPENELKIEGLKKYLATYRMIGVLLYPFQLSPSIGVQCSGEFAV